MYRFSNTARNSPKKSGRSPPDNFKDDPLKFEPGSDWLYTSFGYRLLGCVVAGAADGSNRRFTQDEVFQATAMTRTVPDDAWALVPHRASG